MNKQELLKDYKKQEDKMCIAQILDKIETSSKKDKIEYTDFLDMYVKFFFSFSTSWISNNYWFI